MATLDDFISGLDARSCEISQTLRRRLDESLPETTGQLWHGHPVWLAGKDPVAGFKPYPRYVTFMIWNGRPIEDPSGTLVEGARMRTVKFATAAEIDEELLRGWLRQAAG